MSKSLSKLLFKFVALFGAIGVFCFCQKAKNDTSYKSQNFTCLKSNQISNDEPAWGQPTPGYVTIANLENWSGRAFPSNISPFQTFDNKCYFIGNDDTEETISQIVEPNIVSSSRNVIKVKTPYVIPYVINNITYPGLTGLLRDIYVEDPPWPGETFDSWEEMRQLRDDGAGQLTYKTIKIEGTLLGTTEKVNLTSRCAMNWVDYCTTGHYAMQNMTITFDGDFYDYDQIDITFGGVMYTSIWKTEVSQYGGYIDEEIPVDNPLTFTRTIHPSSQLSISGGSRIQRVSKNAVWYEAPRPFSKGGGAGSFLTKEGANDAIYSELLKDAETNAKDGVSYINGAFVTSGRYVDYANVGANYNNDLTPHATAHFDGPGTYDIVILPEYDQYESSDRKHEIKKLWVFNADSDTLQISTFINEQLEILIYTATAYKDVPAQEYDSTVTEQKAIFDDYTFYDTNESTLTLSNRENFGYQYLTPTLTTMQTGADTQSLSLDKNNSFYSVVNKQENSVPVSYTNIFNVHEYSEAEWKANVVASGSQSFIEHFYSLFNIDTVQYLGNKSETNNKVVFKSADAMFIRITKDGISEELKAETKYTFDNLGKASVVSKTDASYTFECPGRYDISIINRGAKRAVNVTFIIYDINELGVDTTKAVTNEEISFKVNRPEGTSFTSLGIYCSTKVVGAEGEQYGKQEITPLTPQQISDNEFELLSDVKTKDTFNYTETPSLTNKFRYTYYVVFNVLGTVKAYYLYWNFVPVEADTISVDINPTGWMENVGYFTTFDVDMSSSTGWSIKPSTTYDVTINGDAISIDGNKLSAVKEGYASATFTIHGTSVSTTKEFNITDTEELRKEIRCSVSEVNLFTGRSKEITAYANPTSYFTDQDLTYTIENTEVATFSEGVITAVAPGETTLTISHSSPELEDLVIPIKVEDLVIYNLSVNEPSHGSISIEGGKIKYEKGEIAKITIKAETGYYIQTVDFNGEATSYEETQLELSIDKVMDKDYVLTVTFTQIPVPPGPEPTPGGGGSNTGLIVGVCCGVGAVAVGVGVFLIIRAKKVGSMKK